MRSDHLIGNTSHLKSNDTLNQIKAAAQCDEPTSKLIKFVKECCTAAGNAELANSSARWSNSIRWSQFLTHAGGARITALQQQRPLHLNQQTLDRTSQP
jgi:hypothetical protein